MRYDNRLGDAFWAVGGYLEYFLSMMSSWAIVCDVWYLPPIYREVYFLPCCTFIPLYSLMLWHRHRLPLVPTYAWKRCRRCHFVANFSSRFLRPKILSKDHRFYTFALAHFPQRQKVSLFCNVVLSFHGFHVFMTDSFSVTCNISFWSDVYNVKCLCTIYT